MSNHHHDKNPLAVGADSGAAGLQADERSSSPGGEHKRAVDGRDWGESSPGKKPCTSPSESTGSHRDETSQADSPQSRLSRQSPPKNPQSPYKASETAPGLRVAARSHSSASSSQSTGPLSPGLTWIFRNLRCTGVLGSGASALVLRGCNTFTGEEYAVKVMMNGNGSNNGDSLEGPQAEIHCSSAVVKHKLMLPMTTFYPATFKDLEAWMTETYNGIQNIPEQVKQFMDKASVNAEQGLVIGHTSVCQGTLLDEDLDDSKLAAPLYCQFLVGLDFLHTSLGIAHADLHIQNILLKKRDVNVQQEDVQGAGCGLIQIIDFGLVHIRPGMDTNPSNRVMLEESYKESLAKDLLDAATTMIRYYAGRELTKTSLEAMEVVEHLTSWRESGLSFEEVTASANEDTAPAPPPADSSFSSSGGTDDTDEVTKWEHVTKDQKKHCLLVWEKLPHMLGNEDTGILWPLLAREPEPAGKVSQSRNNYEHAFIIFIIANQCCSQRSLLESC